MNRINKRLICFSFIVSLFFLAACSNQEIAQNNLNQNILQNFKIGQADYRVERLNDTILNKKSEDEECFIYDANDQYIIYGISYLNSNGDYLLTRSLNVYDYLNESIVQTIVFKEDAYVGSAIINNSKLFYSKVPITLITESSSGWEIHEADMKSDIIRVQGNGSFCDDYPRLVNLQGKIAFLYEDKMQDGFEFGCSLIDEKSVRSLFTKSKKNDIDDRTSFLSLDLYSNGETAFFFLYESGKLYYTFLNEKGIQRKFLFTDHMYHYGMIHDGLIISQVIDQEGKDEHYQVSVISDKGKINSYVSRFSEPYFRFTSNSENHAMAIGYDESLFLFQYENNILTRTKVLIEGATVKKAMVPFYIGNNRYLVVYNDYNDSVKLNMIILTDK